MMEKNNPNIELDLIDAIQVAAGTIPGEIQQFLIISLPNRVNSCISAQGETIKY